MKILHLATSKSGGAGIAVSRLHTALIAEGHDSVLVTLDEIPYSGSFLRIKNLLIRKIFTLVNTLNTRRGFIATSTFSQKSITKKDISRYGADVIHIHNWYNLLSTKSIADIANEYPTLLTMHDERIYTGACHYSMDCEGFLKGCVECPAVYSFQGKIARNNSESSRLLSEDLNIAVVAPSQWIIDRLRRTILGQNLRLSQVIPNIIPTPASYVTPEIELRNASELNVLFAAVDPELPTKGLDLLLKALKAIALKDSSLRITLNIVGKRVRIERSPQNLSIITHGFLAQASIVSLFRQVNLVVVPSRVDNSPSIVSEAQLNRVLVLGTRVGGIPELIEDSISGLLCEPNESALKESILRSISMANREQVVENAFNVARARHNQEKIVASHLDVYRKLILNG
jgi:glycosyltransferase involved in cell wall biosynthesis